jgi:MULE transposase domain
MQREAIIDAIKDEWNRESSIQDTQNICRDRWPAIPVTHKDIVNIRSRIKRVKLDGRTALQDLLIKLREEDLDFLPYYTHDTADRLTRLLFFHKKSLELWRKNPDIILIDSTYKTNRFGLALTNIVGVTSNNESFFIGNCFMRKEDKEGFLFALNHFKRLYTEASLTFPDVIITDVDAALKLAITKAFSKARHFLYVWHVNKAIQAWVKKLFKSQ